MTNRRKETEMKKRMGYATMPSIWSVCLDMGCVLVDNVARSVR